MNTRFIFFLGAALAFGLSACSESETPKTAEAPAAQQQTAPAQAAQPAAQAHQMSPAQQAAIEAAKGLPKEGTVLQMMHAAGYTYMEVDTGADKPVWIAATMLRVKPQQKVKWTDAAVMKNFPSKTLHRTFDEILFVSNASVIQ
jgi:nucleoid-associated protein YgaU